jgi:general secretion pathway protein F
MKYKISYQINGKLNYKIIEVSHKNDLIKSSHYPQNIINIQEIKSIKKEITFFSKKSSSLELFNQFKIMLNSNLTLSQAIELILKNKQTDLIYNILITLENAIKTSLPIEQALKKYSKFLGNTTILFLKLGMENGNIKEAVNSLVEILEQDKKAYEKLKDTIRYPLILLISLFIAIGMIFIFVIPNFEYIFKLLEGDLPIATQLLLWSKDILINYYYLVILFIATSITSAYFVYYKYQFFFDKIFITKIPIVSKVIQYYIFFKLFLSISIIIKSKYQFQTAIEHSKNIIQNLYIQKSINNILISVKNGSSIAEAFENTKLFDDLTIKLLYTAQYSNNYELVLSDITTLYKQRFFQSLKNFSSTMEPLLILFISLIVLWLVLAIMVPLWDLGSVIS